MTHDSSLITTNPITESIESMVMTTMSSVRVKAEQEEKTFIGFLFLKEEKENLFVNIDLLDEDDLNWYIV